MKEYLFRMIQLASGLFLLIMIFTGCNNVKKYIAPKVDYISYDEKIIAVKNPINVEIRGQTGNIEVYNWDETKVKFEITKK